MDDRGLIGDGPNRHAPTSRPLDGSPSEELPDARHRPARTETQPEPQRSFAECRGHSRRLVIRLSDRTFGGLRPWLGSSMSFASIDLGVRSVNRLPQHQLGLKQTFDRFGTLSGKPMSLEQLLAQSVRLFMGHEGGSHFGNGTSGGDLTAKVGDRRINLRPTGTDLSGEISDLAIHCLQRGLQRELKALKLAAEIPEAALGSLQVGESPVDRGHHRLPLETRGIATI